MRWLELRRARRSGRRDGRKGVPSLDQETLPFDLRAIVARGDGRILRIAAAWRERARALGAQTEGARGELAAVVRRLENLSAQHERAVAEHERRTLEEDRRLARLERGLERFPTHEDLEPSAPGADRPHDPAPAPPGPRPILAEPRTAGPPTPSPAAPPTPTVGGQRVADVAEPPTPRLDRIADPGRRGIGRPVYWPLILLIVVGEIPLNAFAFRLFGESDLLTYVMTSTVAVALIAMAHFAGMLLSRERTKTEGVLLVASVLVPLASIVVIAAIRDAYLERVDGGSGIAPLLGTLGFGLINVTIFAAAAALSFVHHDPSTLVNRRASESHANRERARAERARRKREEARRREEERREDRVRERREEERRRQIAEQHERERRVRQALDAQRRAELDLQARRVRIRREQVLEAIRPVRDARATREASLAELARTIEETVAARAALERRLDAADAERRALWERTHSSILAAKERRDAAMYAYCSANVRARSDHTPPACFGHLPDADVPEGFAVAEGGRG